jgi:hypothetical protein
MSLTSTSPAVAHTSPSRTPIPITGKVKGAADVAGAFALRLLKLGRPGRLLLAEDNPTNQFVALRLLKRFDLRIDVVSDGLKAVRAAATFRYDAICMDVDMPEMDGLAATRAIRVLGSGLATTPIIALTANTFPEDVAACFKAGMTGFVAKPVRGKALLTALLTALDARGAIPAAGSATIVSGPDQPLDHAGFEDLKQAIGTGGVTELLTMFEAETRAQLTAIADPGLAPARLVVEVNTLMAGAASVCAASLSRLAASLERSLRHGGTMTRPDLVALTEAFEAWRVAVNMAWLTDPMAA